MPLFILYSFEVYKQSSRWNYKLRILRFSSNISNLFDIRWFTLHYNCRPVASITSGRSTKNAWRIPKTIFGSVLHFRTFKRKRCREYGRLGWPWQEIRTESLVSGARYRQRVLRSRYTRHFRTGMNINNRKEGQTIKKSLNFFLLSFSIPSFLNMYWSGAYFAKTTKLGRSLP